MNDYTTTPFVSVKRSGLHTALVFSLIGFGIFSYLCFMLLEFPLFDWAVTDINWTREWLYMTCIDYEGAALCLAIIAIYSESNVFIGILWGLSFCLLGSPCCCAYIVYRLLFKSIVLSDTDYRHLNHEWVLSILLFKSDVECGWKFLTLTLKTFLTY